MAKSDDILKKYGITQVKGSESGTGTTGGNSSSSGSTGTGVKKADDILSKYGIAQVRPSSFGTAKEWSDAGNSLLSEIQESFSKWRKTNDDEQNRLQAKINSYISQAERWRSHYADDDEVVSYIDSMVSALSKASSYASQNHKYYSQWDTEDAYIKGAGENREQRQQIYEANKKRIEEIDSELPWYGKTFLPSAVEKLFLSGDKDALMDEREALVAENLMYERGEGGWTSKVSDDYYKVTQAPNFETGSANRNHGNPTRDELTKYDALTDSSTWYYDENDVLRDAFGNEIVKDASGNLVNPLAQDYTVTDRLGLFLSASERDIEEYAGTIVSGTWGNIIGDGLDGSWNQLTKDEIDIYYYLLNTSGQETADKYLSDMKTELNRRQTLKGIEQWNASYDEANLLEKIALNAATVPVKFLSNITGSVENAANTLRGESINPYSFANSGMHFSSTVRGNTAEELDATGFKVPLLDKIGIDFTLGDIYQTGISRIDSALATSVFGGGGAVFLGMGAAQEEAYKLYKQGASEEQITIGAFAAGAAEAFFEKLSYGKLKEIEKVGSPFDWVKSVLVQGYNELYEEAATEVSNIISNALVMGSQSDLAELYKDNKESAKKTFKDILSQVAHSAFGGFLGGAAAGIGQSTSVYVDTTAKYRNAGSAIMSADGGVVELKNLANEIAGVSEGKMKDTLTKQAGKVSDKVATGEGIRMIGAAIKNSSNATKVGRLYNTVQTANNLANASANQADIAKSLQRKGFNADTAKDIAAALVAQYNGQELDKAQVKLLESVENSKYVKQAISDIMDNAKSTMGQRSDNIRNFNKGISEGIIRKAFGIDSKAARKAEEKQFTPEGTYETSADGKSIRTDTGDIIEIKGVASISKGEMLLDIGDGNTINAKDVSFASKDLALVYEAVASIGDNVDANTANKLIQQFKGGNAMVFARGMAQAYTYGFYGYHISELMGENSLATELTQEQRNYAYNLGSQYRNIKDKADKAKARTTKATGAKGVYFRSNDGTVTDFRSYEKDSNIVLKDVQKTAIDVMERLSNIMGVRFNVFESWVENGTRYYLDENGVKTKGNPNGFYDPRTGEIYIDLNAGNGYEGVMLFTVAHELTHFMRQWSPEHFTQIAKIVFKHGGMKGHVSELVAAKQAKAKAKGKPISYDRAMEECVADGMETILKDGKVVEFMADVKQKDHQAWEKIKEWFKKLADLLKDVVSAYSTHSAQTLEGRNVASFAEDLLRQIEQIYAEGAVEAGDTFRAAQEQFSTDSIRGTADGAVAQSEVATALTESDDVLNSDRTEFEALPKQMMSLSTGAGTLLHSIEGLIATKIKGLSGKTINGYTGRDVRGYAMGISGFTKAQINQVNKFMDAMADFMEKAGVTYKFIGLQDVKDAKLHYTYNADGSIKSIVLSAMVKNGDYPVNFDLSSICKKRVAMSKLIDNLARRGSLDSGTVKLTPANIFKINTALKNAGYETACLGCFVESKRYNSLEWAKKFCNKWNAAVKKVNPNATYFGYGNATFNEDSFTLEQAMKIDAAANKYITATKTERLGNALAKYRAKEEAGLPLVESFSKAARERLVKADISEELKTKYLNSDVTTLNMADVEFLLENGILPGATLSNKQAVTELVKSGEAYQHLLRPSDLLTDRGISKLEALPNFHGVLYGHYGSGTPKLMQSYTPYNSEIALLPNKKGDQSLAEYLYTIAGVRMQSFSDFQIQNIYDYLQMVADLAARKVPAHAYTKEISFAKLLGMTGIKVNLSVMFDIDPMVDKAHAGLTKLNKLVHRGEYAKVVLEDAQGKWVYNIGDYQTQKLFAEAYPEEAKRFLQSIGFADAVKLQSSTGYSANCGIIGVGYSDLGIFAMLDDNRIRYIIPYHASSLPAEIKLATHIALGTDYTPYQNNMKISGIVDRNGNQVNWTIKEAYKRLGSGQAVINELNEKVRSEGWVISTTKAQTGHGTYGLYENLQETNDPRQTASNFMDWCIGNSTLPLFYQFASHENYYKLLYDFNVYDCVTEEYAPQQAVTNTYPTMVDGQVQPGTVTDGGFDAEYLQGTIDKQMAFMDAYNSNLDEDLERLADSMEDGTLFSDRVSDKETVLYSDRDNVPTFYSQMAKVIEGVKQEKLGAASVVSMLRGKGVKAEEIKWSGIEEWLAGKKSVTKAELQEFIAGSMLQIEEDTLDGKDRPYTEDQQKRLDEYEAKRDEVAKRLVAEWKNITGDDFPVRNPGADLESVVVNKIIDANKEHKDKAFEGKLLKKLRNDLKEVIANNDDFGFDSWKDALRSIHRHRRDFISNYEMSSNDKAVIVKYCNALNAYNELPNLISNADSNRLRAIARETEPWTRKIMEVKHERNEEEAKYMTNWGQYTLKGGRNYREVLFRIPGSTYTNEAMMTHWKDRNGVLAHARVQDMDTFIGTMLFIEEIQSDWHNEGHKSGYRDPGVEDKQTLARKMNEYTEEFFASPIADVVREKITAVGYEGAGVSMILNYLLDGQESMQSTLNMLSRKGASFTESEANEISKYAREYEEMYHKWQTAPGELTAPDAPFKDNYHEYVLKRLLREAAEQDYVSIGWTTAETQDERWANNRPHKEGEGKSGFLKGYTIEYDQEIPKFLNKYGKKWGTSVGKTTLDSGTEVWFMYITDEMKESVLTEGQPLYSDRENGKNTLAGQGTVKYSNTRFFPGNVFPSGMTHTAVAEWANRKDVKTGDKRLVLHRGAFYRVEKFDDMDFRYLITKKFDAQDYEEELREYGEIDSEESVQERIDRVDALYREADEYGHGRYHAGSSGAEYGGENLPLLSVDQDTTEGRRDPGNTERDRQGGLRDQRQTGRESLEWTPQELYDKMQDLDRKLLKATGRYATTLKNLREHYASMIDEMNGWDSVMLSERSDDSVSNRSLLANAFEGVAQNDIERNKIQEYKGQISLINAEERKLSELNEKIKELSFAKGPKDTKAIRDLQFEARQTANRINTYDKILLRLEASKPLQDVLAREKKLAYQKAEKQGKEALAAYKERAAKTQRELMDRWQESRKRGIENREKTFMRHKIQSVVGDLNQLLLSNDKKRHVPDSLKKAVADALALVNMDTVGAEERAAKYAALIAKETDPDKIDSYTMTMENILRQGDKMGQRLKELRDAYEEIQDSDDPDIANAYDPVIAGSLKELAGSIGNTSLRNMTIEQLSDVYDMYKMVLTRVRDANKSFLNEKKEAISALASRVVGEVRVAGGEHKMRVAMLDPVRKFLWNNLKPVYAFAHMGSDTLTEAFNTVRKGEDVWAVDVTEAREYYLDKSKKYGYDSWDFKKKYRFESGSGLEFELTLDQILSLYAYSKREQAHEHLKLGGFVFDSNIETYKEQGSKIIKYRVNTADAHQITPDILANIISNLSDDQKGFVDEMQDYLSTVMGAKGNEITMKMYGVKLFKEKFYFPLKSAKQFMFEQNEVSGEVRIKNSGFTNKVVAHANNPVILSNFMDVWSGHVNDMSMYHAFVLPLEDFNRIFNYNSPKLEGQPPVSVKGTIQSAYTPAAVSYVKQLITDLNGGARSDPATGILNWLTGLFKKGSVFASLSVVVQQPSAIARAAALVDTKYFIGPKVDHKRHKALWDEVKKYAPVAIIKEMGYFDTNMGKSTQDFIQGKEYSGFKEKMKALVIDSNYRDEVLSKAPALADEIAWCAIWEAVKRETKAQYPGLDAKSEPFLMLAGSRFTEVITKTQVYDSVLSRSAHMRSKDTGMKMATAFMAEPTTSINMIADALLQGKRGNRKYCRAAIGAVVASQILNSILVSFVYAGRDDDEDETYAEKYIGTLTGEIWDSLNPAGYIPFIKDIQSIVQGYDVERSDMAVISDLWNAIQNLSKDNVSVYRKVEGFAGSIAQIFGLPVKNIMRDVRGIYQTIMSFVNGQQTTGAGIGYAVKGAITGKDVSDQQQLYEAYLSGDQAQISRVESRYKDKNAAHSALRLALRENDPRIREAAIAWNANDLDEYMRLAKAIIAEKHFTQDDVVMAIRAEASKLEPDGDTSSTSKAKGLFTTEKFVTAIAQGDEATANAAKMDIIQTAQKNGKTEKEAEKSFVSSVKSEMKEQFLAGAITESQAIDTLVDYCGETHEDAEEYVGQWVFQQEYGFSWSDRADAYKSGKISADELVDILVKVGGKTEEEAMWQVKIYDWQNEGFDIDSNQKSVVEDYETFCEPAGIDKHTYFNAYLFYADSGEEGVAYSKTIECMPYIDSLPLSSYQKTALAKCWWAESTVNKYKTW